MQIELDELAVAWFVGELAPAESLREFAQTAVKVGMALRGTIGHAGRRHFSFGVLVDVIAEATVKQSGNTMTLWDARMNAYRWLTGAGEEMASKEVIALFPDRFMLSGS